MTFVPHVRRVIFSAPILLVGAAACSAPDASNDSPENVDDTVSALVSEREISGIHSQQGETYYGEKRFTLSGAEYRLGGFPSDRIVPVGRTEFVPTSWERGIAGTALIAPTATDARSLAACTTPTSGYDLFRDCGWRVLGVGTCTPNERIELSKTAECPASTPNCADDQLVMRVCSGTAACDFAQARSLQAGSSCGRNRCSTIVFECPSTGHYTVMIPSAYDAAGADFRTKVAWSNESRVFPPRVPVTGKDLVGAEVTARFTADGQGARTLRGRIRAAIDPRERPRDRDAEYLDFQGRDSSARTWLYDVVVDVPDGNGGYRTESLCEPTPEPHEGASEDDALTKRLAVAIDATFAANGKLLPTAGVSEFSTFAFACLSGPVGKCYKWGYRPWGGADKALNRKRLEACVRMARADYCGDGVEHTEDATPIHHWDDRGSDPTGAPSLNVASRDGFLFEAGWDENGAVCLSKLRWKHLGIERSAAISESTAKRICKDPRKSPIFETVGEFLNEFEPRFCDSGSRDPRQVEEERARFAKARMFNRSAPNDWWPRPIHIDHRSPFPPIRFPNGL